MAKNLSGDTWCEASDSRVINITNPATNELIDTVPESTKEDCDKAVIEARKAQKECRYTTPPAGILVFSAFLFVFFT